jgi:hypothetical protein
VSAGDIFTVDCKAQSLMFVVEESVQRETGSANYFRLGQMHVLSAVRWGLCPTLLQFSLLFPIHVLMCMTFPYSELPCGDTRSKIE